MTARAIVYSCYSIADVNKLFFKCMNDHTALDWIRMGNLDPIIGEEIFL